jgi:2-dehydropantoate 2-reductase
VIIGAGAVGGTLGARLTQAGHDVVLVARGLHLEAIQRKGLQLVTPQGDTTHRPSIIDGPRALGSLDENDVLVLAVKTQDTETALLPWTGAPVRHHGTAAEHLPLVHMQNGIEGPRIGLRRFSRTYATCVWLPSSFSEPGVVHAYGHPRSGVLHLGRYPSGADDLAQRIARDLTAACFDVSVTPNVSYWLYAKLLGNLNNALEALSGPITTPEAIRLAERVRAEGEAVLAAAGIAHASRAEQLSARVGRADLFPVSGVGRAGGSSWQSLLRGTGTIEADHLNGEIVFLGRLHGVPAPLNELLQRLANRFALERLPAGSLPLPELIRLAGRAVSARRGT